MVWIVYIQSPSVGRDDQMEDDGDCQYESIKNRLQVKNWNINFYAPKNF